MALDDVFGFLFNYSVSVKIKNFRIRTMTNFRSLYSGALFHFLQSDDHEKEPQSIEEISDKDFKFFLIPTYDDLSRNMISIQNK